MTWIDLLRAMRVAQWTKNSVVLAAYLFALGDQTRTHALRQTELLIIVGAALLFCVVSSGIYVLNDLMDADHDQSHPIKRHRPIASGRISRGRAWGLMALLLGVGIAGALQVKAQLAGVLLIYIVLQVSYSLGLKRIMLLDVFLIAFGFVLRAVAGAVAIAVPISLWLLLCTFLLALFLALCKRRHEKILLEDAAEDHRASLGQYNRILLDLLIGITGTTTIIAYAVYTVWPDTILKFHTAGLAYTIPLVLFGVFRYLYLVYRRGAGGRPEKVLLTDLPLLIALALYVLSVLAVFYYRT